MRKTLILAALLLEGVLGFTLIGLVVPALAAHTTYVQEAPWPLAAPSPEALASDTDDSLQSGVFFTRVQTVTLHTPVDDTYANSYTTTIRFRITDYPLSPAWYIVTPGDAITREVTCTDNATCQIIYQTPHQIVFSGTGEATVYMHYDTASKATREPGSRVINLKYGTSATDEDLPFRITNTIQYTRTGEPLEFVSATPLDYEHNVLTPTVRWVYSSTRRIQFTAAFTEPLLGSDLVIDRLEMSPEYPEVGQTVHYTIVVRNQGDYGTGRAVLAELFVRPYAFGPPIVLTDHVGGWWWIDEHGHEHGYGLDALFKWYFPASYRVYLPLVMRAYQAGSGGVARTSTQVLFPGSHWYPGLGPGGVITGVLSLPWPEECGTQICGVWAKVDPAYLKKWVVYGWWGYNPEGFDCALGEDELPTCEEEMNNIASAFTRFLIYMPVIMQSQ